MEDITKLEIHELLRPEGFSCRCGKRHCAAPVRQVLIEDGAISKLPAAISGLGKKQIFVLTGNKSRLAAGTRVLELLHDAGLKYELLCLDGNPKISPDEQAVAQIEAALPKDCDFILGIGSGVINDLCKLVAATHHIACGIVATAPSMDGYASNSSAMVLGGIKTTVYTTAPELIVCDIDILSQAPIELLRAGFGDMAAKLISIADWRIARLVIGEYYCEDIANMMLAAGAAVTGNADGILRRDKAAIKQMTEGLVLSGIAMNFAGVSRPASGLEHTVSHLLEMFALARGQHPELHGLQVGYGLRIALELYKLAGECSPSAESCERAYDNFDALHWETRMREVFGGQAEALIAAAAQEGRNSRENVLARSSAALENMAAIKRIISAVTAQAADVIAGLDKMGIARLDEPELLGCTKDEARNALHFSRDLRSRYIFSSLCFDLGIDYDIKI